MGKKRDKLGMVDGAKSLNRVLLSTVGESIVLAPAETRLDFERSDLSRHLQKIRQSRFVSGGLPDAAAIQ
jgi:hypothetical protein